jgi:hypothetical protein
MSLRGRLIDAVLGRRRAQRFFEGCMEFGLRGMNFDQSGDCSKSGEQALVERLAHAAAKSAEAWIVFDVGANIGAWSCTASSVFANAGIDRVFWAFEPAQVAHARRAVRLPAIRPQRVALGPRKRKRPCATTRPDLSSRRCTSAGA